VRLESDTQMLRSAGAMNATHVLMLS